jgi:hypothetical protein
MKHAVFAASLAFGMCTAVAGSAASLGLTTKAPSVETGAAVVEFIDFAPDGEIFALPAAIDAVDGIALSGLGTVEFAAGFNLADPSDSTDFAFGGFLDVSDDTGQVLVGELFAIGFVEDAIELQFNNLTGSGAGLFGSSVLALITFDSPLGLNPFDALVDGGLYGATVNVSKVGTPIPLPAGLPLTLAGIGVLAGLWARQNRR